MILWGEISAPGQDASLTEAKQILQEVKRSQEAANSSATKASVSADNAGADFQHIRDLLEVTCKSNDMFNLKTSCAAIEGLRNRTRRDAEGNKDSLKQHQVSSATIKSASLINNVINSVRDFMFSFFKSATNTEQDQKQISHSTPLLNQQGILNIMDGFEKMVDRAAVKSGISMHRLNIDYVAVQQVIAKKVIDGKFDEIQEVLGSYVWEACTSKLNTKRFDEFMTEFNEKMDVMMNQLIHQVSHTGDDILKINEVKNQQVSLKPQNYLNNASVQSHLAQIQDRGLR